MAEQIVSPGVFSREQDLSFISPAPAAVSTAVIGPTVKGPKDIPTVVSSYSEYVNVFGDRFKSGSQYYTHLTAVTAEKFFEQGGGSLLVTRVASGSFTSAQATIAIGSGSGTAFTLETLAEGEIMNNSGSNLAGANNTLISGSADNVRWEVTARDESKGTFTLIVRRGDDTIKEKVILETWSDLSLDPNSPNYISRVIGDVSYTNNGTSVVESGEFPNRSRYIRVASVPTQTVDYLDNNGDVRVASTTGSIPAVGSGSYHGSFEGATGTLFDPARQAKFFSDIDNTDTQGLKADAGAVDAYDNAIAVLGNRDEYNFNVLAVPGLTQADHATTVGAVIDLVQERGDAIAVIDLDGYGSNVSTVVGEATELNSSYASAYWPWVKIAAQAIGKQVWVPASVVVPGVYAFTDAVAGEWFAPAGLIRGGIPGVLRAEKKLTQSDRDTLYQGKVNPVATFPGQGVVAYGQKTLQTKASALDRVNVRRLLIALKRFIGSQSRNLVFEQNTVATRNRFLSVVNPYLERVVQRQGLTAFRVVMDDTNNTADVIDRNQLVGQIYIQPTRTAEFIVLDFVVEPTGATFGA